MSLSIEREKNHDNLNRVCWLAVCVYVDLFLFFDRNWNWLRSIPIEIDCSIHIFTSLPRHIQYTLCLPIQLYFNLTLFNILGLLMIYSRISNQFFVDVVVGDGFSCVTAIIVVDDACYSIQFKNCITHHG